MNKIICGTDFSVHAAEAADVAVALARRHGATVTLVHAVAPHEIDLLERATVQALRKQRNKRLSTEANRLRAAGAKVVEHLVLGRAPDMLAAVAEGTGADLIVVSSLGAVSPIRWLVGSVALNTVQKARVPTLIVREPARMLTWAKGERPLNVFACYDFSSAANTALSWIDQLQDSGPCDVTVAYVSWPPEDRWRLGLGARDPRHDDSAELQSLLRNKLKDRCDRLVSVGEPEVQVAPSWGRPDAPLIQLASAADADVIVLGAKQRSITDRFWTGSVSRALVRHSRGNVLCVPQSYARQAAGRAKRLRIPFRFEPAPLQPVSIVPA